MAKQCVNLDNCNVKCKKGWIVPQRSFCRHPNDCDDQQLEEVY